MLANDIDRLLTIASQQLRLAGNVNNAIMSLEASTVFIDSCGQSQICSGPACD